jgi:ABC-type antimicrobial peptide transport system permease subunit
VLSYTTRQRTHELGIRMALGAGRLRVFRAVVGEGVRLTAVGLAIGVAASVALSRAARGLLYGVAEVDPLTYAVVVCILTIVAFGACAIPGWRAARVHPLDALRVE